MKKNNRFIRSSDVSHYHLIPARIMFALLLSAFLLLVVSTPLLAKTAYVSDQLKIALRSGASDGHRIVTFLRSGTMLTITDTSGDDKFTQVETVSGKSGWVSTKDLMNSASGRARLVVSNKRLTEAKAQLAKLKSSVGGLKSEIRQLKNDKGDLQNKQTNLSNSLEDLKITAANPVALSKKNKQLKKELQKIRANETMLSEDNKQLRSSVMQEWFVIGGAVAIGSMIFGIILTRINWRRKRDSWGDSF